MAVVMNVIRTKKLARISAIFEVNVVSLHFTVTSNSRRTLVDFVVNHESLLEDVLPWLFPSFASRDIVSTISVSPVESKIACSLSFLSP